MPPFRSFNLTDEEVLRRLGARLARERLDRNQTQAALAEEAGVSRATIQRLEGGQSTQVTNLIRVLRALGLAGLHEIVPETPVRPLEELERGGQRRQRASLPEPAEEDQPWEWGPES